MIIGGNILKLIYDRQNKSSNNISTEEVEEGKINNEDLDAEGLILEEFKKNEEMKQHKNIKIIFLIFFVYFVTQFANTSLNQLGFNRIKFWSLEPIFLYIFSKKILNRTIYQHQKISIIAVIICCTIFYLVNSFIRYTDKNCHYCQMDSDFEKWEDLKVNIYETFIIKSKGYLIPIMIILYFSIMVGNAYSIVSIKWLMDVKYIKLFKMILYLGIGGLIFALSELI